MSLILIRLQFSNFCTLYTDYSPWLKFTQFFFFLLNMTDWKKSLWDNLEVLWLHLNMPLIDWYNSVTSSYSRYRKIVGLKRGKPQSVLCNSKLCHECQFTDILQGPYWMWEFCTKEASAHWHSCCASKSVLTLFTGFGVVVGRRGVLSS